LLEQVPAPGDKTVLEVGCGSGGNLQMLFAGFGRRVGLERDRTALRFAVGKLRPGDELVAGDANELSLRDASFDCVALVDVLYHRAIRDVDEVLRRAHAVLRPGGYLLVTDGAHDFLTGRHNRLVGSARRFTRNGLRQHVESAGFVVSTISYWGVLLFFVLLVKRRILERVLYPFRRAGPRTLDLHSVPGLDQFLYWSVRAELPWLRRVGLPIGASVCVLARREA
jgi:SAM-dependent methyltransferase